MPYNFNADLSELIYLKDYSIFIRNSKLEDFVSAYLMNIHSSNIPLLTFFSHITKEELLVTARQGIVRLLTGIESGRAIEEVKQNLDNWKNNGISGIPREAISLKDITLIYSAQKLSFQSFLPYYTADVSVAAGVINEIELYYKQVQHLALDMLETIQQEEQEKRQESENKYRDLFDNATDLIQIVSPDGTILYVNNTWLNTLGYMPKDIEGKLIFDFIKESEINKYKKYRLKIIEGEKIAESIRTRYIKKNGENITIEGSINCKYKNGKAEYTRGIFHDISQKLEQEEKIKFYIDQLAEREENLRDIIENAPDGIIVINKDDQIILWNPKAEYIFGWKKEEVLYKIMSDIIVPPAYRKPHSDSMKRFLLTREAHILNKTIEVTALHKNGSEFYISLTVSHSKQAGKDIFIAFLRDVTEQKKNDIELENKRKQLEKSNQELQQYTWLTSHDLKEPLRKILTFSDALVKKYKKDIPDDAFTYLHKIHSAANRMNGLIEAVLLYSNVTADEHLFEETNLNTIIREVIDDLEILITSKNAIINYPALPVIKAIPVQMRQLFQNLISNAIKYSKPNERPEINISYKKEKDGFTFWVKDNGIGFEEIYAGKIFQVFQRLQTTKTYEGTGIGLALCKKIAEAHKGTIHAESEAGIGSAFVIYLPDLNMELNSPAT